MKTQKLVCTL